MAKVSVRNLVVKQAYSMVASAFCDEDELDGMFSNGVGSYEVKSADGDISFVVTAATPVMTITASLPHPTLDGQDVVCKGWSKLKNGDTWRGSVGFDICCTRVARDYADRLFSDLNEKLSKLEEEAELLLETKRQLSRIYLEGGALPEAVLSLFGSQFSEVVEDLTLFDFE